MVKNSRSFEITKIRHYRDKPYRRLFEAADDDPPPLPALRDWVDEPLGGAIGPSIGEAEPEKERASDSKPNGSARKIAVRKASAKKAAAKPSRAAPAPSPELSLPTAREGKAASSAGKPRKRLSLGAAPGAPAGETCRLKEVISACEAAQTEAFGLVIGSVGADIAQGSAPLEQAVAVLATLHDRFGDDAANS